MKKVLTRLFLLAGFIPVLIFSSCGDDEPVVIDPPFASFSSEVDENNTMMVSFTNNSLDGESYSWDFGDGSGTSTEENPTYTYTESGTYTVTLTVTNAGGTDDTTGEVTVSGFGENIVMNGDFSSEEGWTSTPLWTAEDNATLHGVVDGEFMFKNDTDANGDDYEWSNHMVYTPVTLEAGETYRLEADMRSAGTNGVWFEVYLLDEEPVGEPDGSLAQFFIKSYGDGEDCGASAYNDDIMVVAAGCTLNDYPYLIDADGYFTVSAEDMGTDNTMYLVFKTGSGWGPDGTKAGYLDGIYMDNVSIKKVL